MSQLWKGLNFGKDPIWNDWTENWPELWKCPDLSYTGDFLKCNDLKCKPLLELKTLFNINKGYGCVKNHANFDVHSSFSLFYVQSFYLGSFSTFPLSTFSHSMFVYRRSVFWRSVFRWSIFRRSVIPCSVFRRSVFQRSIFRLSEDESSKSIQKFGQISTQKR
jgi:hypothetical protein